MVTLRRREAQPVIIHPRMKRSTAALPWLAVLLLAAAVRLPGLTAAFPYINYVDEGNLLHPVADMLKAGRWEPGWYMYPSLPLIATGIIAGTTARFGGASLLDDLPRYVGFYDLLSPGVLLVGRLLSLLAGLGTVLLSGLFARRLAGARAGWAAALLAALAPPLVIRGALATVDPWAALFVLAALLFTERLRTTGRPGREALAAGAMAGFAFASKYPAVLVALAPAWTILRCGRPWREQLRLLLLAAAGAVAAAVAAMPGLVLHPRAVWEAIHDQGGLYASLGSPVTLWRQAFVRAEWDLPYDHPEIGAVFFALVLAGLVVAWRDRVLAPAVQGWSLYAAVTLLLFSRYPFHPFRNLLPLIPLACILVAMLYSRLYARLPRSAILIEAAALVLLVALFAVPLVGWGWERLHLHDSRSEAVDWLARRARPEDEILVLRDLAILPGELDRLEAGTMVRRWPKVERELKGGRFRFLVAGEPRHARRTVTLIERREILDLYTVRARFGENPTPPQPLWWHGNRQTVYILEKRPNRTGSRSVAPADRGGADRRSSPP